MNFSSVQRIFYLDCGSSGGGMAEALAQLGNTRLKQSEKQIIVNANKKVWGKDICAEKP
jgi:hypothetical protein